MDSTTYSAQGYNAYFSFSRAKTGYSGEYPDESSYVHEGAMLLCCLPLPGVVTFCRESVTPLRAEEGLSGVFLERREDGVGCYCESPVTLSPEVWASWLLDACVVLWLLEPATDKHRRLVCRTFGVCESIVLY